MLRGRFSKLDVSEMMSYLLPINDYTGENAFAMKITQVRLILASTNVFFISFQLFSYVYNNIYSIKLIEVFLLK